MRNLPDTLIGQIVLISLPSNISDTVYDTVFRVTSITDFLYGDFIAGSIFLKRVKICYITNYDYEILTIKELPLLIGYKHTSDLLAELIRDG